LANYILKNGKPLVVRNASVGDAETIVAVVSQVTSEVVYLLWDPTYYNVEVERNYIARANEKQNILILVAEEEGRIVGVGELKIGDFRKNKHIADLGIAVVNEFRRLGVGTSLMKEMILWARKNRLEKICLSVFSTNKGAFSLYERFDFAVEAVRRRQFKLNGVYVDEILMAKFLN
jgi:RimJ/RimL family protein N-acetyltransferase